MSTQAAPPAPPTTLSKDGDGWDDNNMLHFCNRGEDGLLERTALCGTEIPPGNNPITATIKCPICVALHDNL